MFDHTLVVAEDDPMLEFFKHMNEIVDVESKNHLSPLPHERGALCDLRIVSGVGCEKFAELAYLRMNDILKSFQQGLSYTLPNGSTFEARYPVGRGVRLRSVEVFEHNANSAVYEG